MRAEQMAPRSSRYVTTNNKKVCDLIITINKAVDFSAALLFLTKIVMKKTTTSSE